MDDEKYGDGLVFFDLLFNLLCCFIILFSLAYILINEEAASKKQAESVAEFLITSVWAQESNDDVDLYVQDPLNNLTFFRSREIGLMNLSFDDLGSRNDTIRLPSGEIIKSIENREVVTLRGIIAGEYIVNVHMYRKEDADDTPITVKLEKINPRLQLIKQKEVVLSQNGDEETAFRFTLNKEGDVIGTNDMSKSLTELQSTYGYEQ